MSLSNPPHTPLVTVGIPTLNGGNNIIGVVQSVLATNIDPNRIEIIISDNASDDDGVTQRVGEELAAKHPQVRYFRHPVGLGWLPNWDFVLQQAQGKYFMWLADDDHLLEGVLERYVDFLEGHEDYSLVCGKIDYILDGSLLRTEEGLSQEHQRPAKRVASYYWKVGDGAMVYGLMRTELAQKIEHVNQFGMDWHHVAAMTYQGKVKQLDFVGYKKILGGRSRTWFKYARAIGLHPFWGNFPTLKMGLDVYHEIVNRVPVYKDLSWVGRVWLAFRSSAGIILPWYLWGNPKRIVGGWLKKLNLKTDKTKQQAMSNV